MNCPVVAYEPMPATILNIAIKPLKRSAPKFSILKNIISLISNLIKRGTPNDLIMRTIKTIKQDFNEEP